MKRKIEWICASLLAVGALTGCLKEEDNSDYERLRPVLPGISIYKAAEPQNAMALQPADIAVKFEMLRAEAEKQGKPDQFDMVIVQNYGNVKTLLLGVNTKITGADGVYDIAFAGGGGLGSYDSYARMGTVRIDTKGKALSETDNTVRWEISLGSDKLEIVPNTVSNAQAVTLLSTGKMTLYRDDNKYRIELEKGVSYYVNKSIEAAWTGAFAWVPMNLDDLSFSAQKGTKYGFSGRASGNSYWTMDGKTSMALSYELTDGQYDPSDSNYSRHMIGGTEVCTLLGTYNVTEYPSPTVKYTWTLREKRLYYKVDYNDHTLELVY